MQFLKSFIKLGKKRLIPLVEYNHIMTYREKSTNGKITIYKYKFAIFYTDSFLSSTSTACNVKDQILEEKKKQKTKTNGTLT